MALQEYKRKRSFSGTPEPQGGRSSGKTLEFVVQKHAASRLHYDFRLEVGGVLKSWAVPKGPSMNPADKRLAMQVEDHPFDYKDFEGVIPPGNYGAGTVIIWDAGTYEPLEKAGEKKADQEKELQKGLRNGTLKFSLNGKKLKGEFALVKTKGRGENSWLLIKHRDRYATEEVITDKDKSVVSKKTLEQVGKDPKSKEWQSNRAGGKRGDRQQVAGMQLTGKQRTGRQQTGKRGQDGRMKGKRAASEPENDEGVAGESAAGRQKPGHRAAMPKDLSPMLATLVDKPFEKEGWRYEIKWDGYRALSYLRKGKVEIHSRNNKSFDDRFYPVYDALQQWDIDAVVDGEIVVLDDEGRSKFESLQNWRSEADGELIYYLFDILWLNGRDLMGLPLSERKDILRSIAPDSDIIRISEDFSANGKDFFAAAQKIGLEGVIAKKDDSLYVPAVRSREWLKIKASNRQEVVIGGYTRNEGSSKLFSSLLVGVFEKGKLRYTGKVGTGFTQKMQKEMMKKFGPLEQRKSPFSTEPDVNKPSRFRPEPPAATAVWLKPVLLCEVAFTEITSDGVMRHPSFEGMREDKNAKDVKREEAEPVEEIVSRKTVSRKTVSRAERAPKAEPLKKTKSSQKAKPAKNPVKEKKTNSKSKTVTDMGKLLIPSKNKDRKTLLNPTDESQVRSVNGHDLTFTHLSKIFWPKEKYTKRDLLNYYYQVAPYILPYLKDRPQSLNRYPNGINGKSFYQKDVKGKAPDWIATFPYHSEGDERDKEFLVCTDEASLLYMISLGCIEVNPWNSRVQAPDQPDWCIIDLDPGKSTTFEQVIEAALVTRDVLKTIGVECWCKTSGATGMHIYFPLGARYAYEQSKEFARMVVKIVHAQIPQFTSIERTLSARRGKMYLDFLQNRPQATIAAPYAVRPKPGATVSAPLYWEEVKKGLTIQKFTMKNMPARLKETGDLFKPVLGKGIAMEKTQKKLEALLKEAVPEIVAGED